MSLKYHYPVLVFVAALGITVYLSFKHAHTPEAPDRLSATDQERMDQITLSAMHAEPAAAEEVTSAPAPDAKEGIAAVNATEADLAKLKVLDELLAAKNDNDPRMDTELKQLTPAAKALIRGKYSATAAEMRNQRGTMVFLVGRALSTPEDAAFLKSVLNEAPCLSLADCRTEERGSVGPDEHHQDVAREATLAYPQLVALKSIESYLSRPEAGELTPQLLAGLEAAKQSPVRKIAALAEEISRDYQAKHP